MNCIPNKSDFKFLVKFKDTTLTVINPLDFEWDISYYTTPEIKFTSFHKLPTVVGGAHTLSPNVIIREDRTIEIRVDNFDFCKKGEVKRIVNMYFHNTDFLDGVQKLTIPEKSANILII